MDVVLEEACRGLAHGGDHESRKYVARKLTQSVKKGNITLEGLRPVASRALSELSSRKSAWARARSTFSRRRLQQAYKARA
jgi:hypothetical protein